MPALCTASSADSIPMYTCRNMKAGLIEALAGYSKQKSAASGLHMHSWLVCYTSLLLYTHSFCLLTR